VKLRNCTVVNNAGIFISPNYQSLTEFNGPSWVHASLEHARDLLD